MRAISTDDFIAFKWGREFKAAISDEPVPNFQILLHGIKTDSFDHCARIKNTNPEVC